MKQAALFLVAVLSAGLDASGVRAADRAPVSMRDPFAVPLEAVHDDGRRNPLQRYPLKDLRLVATVFGIDSPRALVEDPTGLGFVIRVGHVLGTEEARVTRIEAGYLHLESVEKSATQPAPSFSMALRSKSTGEPE
jgi:Tfp pilus assembly protein PilP